MGSIAALQLQFDSELELLSVWSFTCPPYVLHMSSWASSEVLQPPKSMPLGGLAMLGVNMHASECVGYPEIDWCPTQGEFLPCAQHSWETL